MTQGGDTREAASRARDRACQWERESVRRCDGAAVRLKQGLATKTGRAACSCPLCQGCCAPGAGHSMLRRTGREPAACRRSGDLGVAVGWAQTGLRHNVAAKTRDGLHRHLAQRFSRRLQGRDRPEKSTCGARRAASQRIPQKATRRLEKWRNRLAGPTRSKIRAAEPLRTLRWCWSDTGCTATA